jgi:hypothetical protein
MENITVSPKEETLEEAAERILLGEDLDLSDYDKRHILKAMVNIAKWQKEQFDKLDIFFEGVKWQQEQDKNKYSEGDMIDFIANELVIEKKRIYSK